MESITKTLPILPRLESAVFAPAPDAEYIRALLRLADVERTELLEALTRIATWLGPLRDQRKQVGNLDMAVVDAIRAAVAKATA